MGNQPLLAYFIARRNAADLDRRGIPPNLLIRLIVGIATVSGFGLMLMAGFVVLLGVAGAFGVIS